MNRRNLEPQMPDTEEAETAARETAAPETAPEPAEAPAGPEPARPPTPSFTAAERAALRRKLVEKFH